MRLLFLLSLLLLAACARGDAPRSLAQGADQPGGPARRPGLTVARVSTSDSLLLAALADSTNAFSGVREQAAEDTVARNAAAARLWEHIVNGVAAVESRTPESAEREWLIGAILVEAYEFDVHAGSFEMAEQRLLRSMELDGKYAAPRLSLARLYVNASLELAPRAEALYRGTVVTPGSADERQVHEGLAYALYYQSRVAEAVTEARTAIKLGATNPALRQMVSDFKASRVAPIAIQPSR